MERYSFIHGSSVGQSFFIPNDDVKTVCEDIAQKYFAGRNYRQNKSEAKHALFVEIYKKNDNGENFCAYTFINNDCIGANDREGQYFAITILCKGFYTYPETVYNMLNQAYNGLYSTKKIIGKTEDGKDKYVIQQFIEQKDLLSNVLKQVDNAFDNITNNCVKVIKKSNTIADYNSWEGNKMCLNVCNSEESYFSLCQIGRIYISNEYPSPSVIVNSLENKIKKLEKDIQEKENNANTEFRSKTSELRKEIEELSKQISERDKVIEKLNDNITEYNNTIDIVKSSLEKYAKVGNKISDVKESKSSYKSKSKIDLLKICILFIILIFTILSAFLNYSFFRNTTSHFEAIGEKIKENKLSETQVEDFQQATYLTIGDNSDTITFGSTKEEKKEIKISTNGLWDIYNLDVINRNNWVRLCKVSYDYGDNKSDEYLQVTIVEDNQNSVVRSIPVTITAGELRRDIIICQNGKTSISEVWYNCTNQTQLVRDYNDPQQTFIKYLGGSDTVLKLEDVNKFDWVKVKTNDGTVGYVGINKLKEVSNN